MTIMYPDEYQDDEILQGFHEEELGKAERYELEFDDAEIWLAAQDVPDWTSDTHL